MQISNTAVEAIKKSNSTIGRLMGAFDKSEDTIRNWLKPDRLDIRLTTPLAVQIIAEETGLTQTEILESSEVEPQGTAAA